MQMSADPAAGPLVSSLLGEIVAFLYREAELLDTGQLQTWLMLTTEDIVYRMPIRVTRDCATAEAFEREFVADAAHFEETRHTLATRIKRLESRNAWAEEPPSRTRHFVTNIRVEPTARATEYAVKTNVLVYRNRGDSPAYDLLSAERHDVLRRVDGALTLARRIIYLDQSTLGTLNLAIFI